MPSAPPTVAVTEIEAPSLARGATASHSVTIDVDPAVSKFYGIGAQSWVYIPANAICAEGSGYGPDMWEESCTPATGIQTFQVTVRYDNGSPSAEFFPDVRFAPTTSTRWSDWAILGLKVQGNLNKELGYGILFRPTGSTQLIDEAATDPSLKAFRTIGNVIARRIKHFSGYNVSLGFEETTDPISVDGAL